MPSSSLSNLYGLALDAQSRHILGESVDLDIEAHDETNARVPVRSIIRRFKRNSNRGVVLLVGVQTNQFARAVDIARELRAAGIQVAIGGFHVSGCLAMLPEMPPEMTDALALGITLFAGEAEERLDALLLAAFEDRLAPVYNYMADLPAMDGKPLPFLPMKYVKRYAGALGCFDAGRGCPFSCSFCTIINVQGRKSRHRSADDIEQLVRAHAAQGVRSFFITDDNFARNKNWEAILDRIIMLKRRDRLKINIIMQVDTMCHKIPNFVEKSVRAGCKKVFIGLENINPDSLKGASKGQNRITEYRKMLQAWKRAKVLTYAGYILGFPSDTPASIERDIAIIQRELPIDIMEFFMLTPLPGSKDHQEMYLRGERMDADTNKYDAEHATADHPQMSAAEWQDIYQRAWHLYYSPSHIETSDQARGRQRNALAADDLDDFLFLRQSRLRAGASAARRDYSPQASHTAPSGISARERAEFFRAALARDARDLLAGAVVLLAAGTAAKKDRERSRIETLYGCRAQPRR